MNKKPIKIISISIIIMLSLASLMLIASSQTIQNPTKPEVKNGNIFENINQNILNPYQNTYTTMPNPMPIQTTDENDFSSISIIDTPSEFNWKNYNGQDWTTYVKNQRNCGSCWLFGGLGALESVIKIKEDNSKLNPDLSEQFVLSCMPEAGSCNGGNVDDCVYYYILNEGADGYDCNGVIYDECLTYQSSFDYIPPCVNKCQNWDERLVPIKDYEEGWYDPAAPNLNDLMKSAIYEKGPIMAYYWVTDRFIDWGRYNKDPTDYYKDQNEDCPYLVNHAIVLVGWKDDPSIGNGGYWIVKNSWGTDWGYNGFFNIEYDTLNMGAFFAWVDYDPESFDWPPVADSGGFYQAESNQEIIFNSDESIDVDGEIISYKWDFGDGTTSTGKTITHSYSQSGIYKVELTVTDDNNQTSTDITLAGIDMEPIDISIKSGLFFDITIENPTNYDLFNKQLNVQFDTVLISGKSREEFVSIIQSQGQQNIVMTNIGFGIGTINIELSGYEMSDRFFIIGPFVLIL
jgi:C1A family cysteine protease